MDKYIMSEGKIIPIHLRNVPPPCETFDHRSLLVFLAKWIKPQIYVEYGVRNSNVLSPMLDYCEKIYAVDLSPCNYSQNSKIKFYQMSTDDFCTQIIDKEKLLIDMVFIDADHSHEQSLKDFNNIFPFVIEDGLILLHDTYPYDIAFTDPSYCHDAYKTAWYIKQNYQDKCEIVTLPFNPGFSIVRKCKKQLAWKDK